MIELIGFGMATGGFVACYVAWITTHNPLYMISASVYLLASVTAARIFSS